MIRKIGLCREYGSNGERRAPLVPSDVGRLVRDHGWEVAIQPSSLRVFPDAMYVAEGARLDDDIAGCDLVLGMNGISAGACRPAGACMFFSSVPFTGIPSGHVFHGGARPAADVGAWCEEMDEKHPQGMAMLRRLKSLGCTFIDYARVTDERGRRLVYQGRYAGIAGMIDALWTLGQRLRLEGYETPFEQVKQAFRYADLRTARNAIGKIGEALRDRRLPGALRPMVFGFVGSTNVSKGAQEIFDLLPHREITPFELAAGAAARDTGSDLLKVVFQEEHMVRPKDENRPFVLSEYFQHPNYFRSDFGRYLGHLTVLMNGSLRLPGAPMMITKAEAAEMWEEGHRPRLRVVNNMSGDINNGIEFADVATLPEAPAYVYEPAMDDIAFGVDGRGPVVLTVENAACELPAEASEELSRALMPFMNDLARADLEAPFEKCGLPAPLKRAVILWRGKLAPDYEYLRECLRKKSSDEESEDEAPAAPKPSRGMRKMA